MADIYGNQPSAGEIEGWQNQRSRVGLNYGHANAQNAFSRAGVLQNRNADFGGLRRQFAQMRQQVPQQYNGRGLLNSGLYTQGLQNYAQQRTQGFGDLARKYQQMLGGLDMQRQQGAENQFADMTDINTAERARRAELAAQIRSL